MEANNVEAATRQKEFYKGQEPPKLSAGQQVLLDLHTVITCSDHHKYKYFNGTCFDWQSNQRS